MTKEELNNLTLDNITEENIQYIQNKLWIDQASSQFDALLRNNYHLKLDEFCNIVLKQLAQSCQAIKGAFYTSNSEQSELFQMTAGYACIVDEEAPSNFKTGEGLIGQAAKSLDIIYIDNLQINNIVLQTSTGKLSAVSLLLIPLEVDNNCLGVIELFFSKQLTVETRQLIEKLSLSISSALNNIQSKLNTQRLLIQAQLQTNELTNSQEELRQNLEELNATSQMVAEQAKVLEQAQVELVEKNRQLEEMKKEEGRLLQEKLKMQQKVHQTIVDRLKEKIKKLSNS